MKGQKPHMLEINARMAYFLMINHISDVKEVLEVRVKDDDNDAGLAYEHYYVRCRCEASPTMAQMMNLAPEDQTTPQWEQMYLVDARSFHMWLNKKSITQKLGGRKYLKPKKGAKNEKK